MKNLLFFFLLFFTLKNINAQYTETLTSDRPGQAFSVNTVGRNVFQVQAGVDYFDSSTYFYPSSFFRFGISEKLELNSGFIVSSNNLKNDLESFTIGARFLFSNIDSHLKSSIQFSYDVGAQNQNSQFTYILGGAFSDNFGYTLNLGINFDEKFSLNTGIYVFNFSYSFNDKIGFFIEPFGTFLNKGFQVNFDTGLYYIINNNLQLDAQIGANEGFFVGTGVTWRIPIKRR